MRDHNGYCGLFVKTRRKKEEFVGEHRAVNREAGLGLIGRII